MKEIKLNEIEEEYLRDVLSYIEKESESWDEEKLKENGLIDVVQLILEASCKRVFIEAYEYLEKGYPILSLSEKTLYDQSNFFYRDCLYSLIKQNLPESNEEINFDEFYDFFVKFIKSIREIKIEEGMEYELRQLIELLENAYFTSEDKFNLIKKKAQKSLRYVQKDADHEIDVLKQTQRFWLKWIVEESPKQISKAALLKKNMKKPELLIWLLLAAIDNFAEHYGDSELKELRECILNYSKKNEKDISPILKWCFKSFDAIKSSDKNYQIMNEKDYLQGLQGIFSIMERFHYVHFTVKKVMKEEMEFCWKEDKKIFSSQIASDAWLIMKRDSLKTPEKLVGGWVKENKKLRLSGKEFLERDVKKIWKDINTDYLYFDQPNEYGKESYDRDGQTEEWELGLELFEKIWCNKNFERIKEYYIKKLDNGSMIEAEFESVLNPIWELAWELFEKIWLNKNMQNGTERISVDEFRSTMEYNYKLECEILQSITDKDIEKLKKEYEKKHGNKSLDAEFSDVLASELEKKIELYEQASNHQVNFFTVYIITALIEKISSEYWEYGLLSVKHIVFAKMYILISELSDEDIKEWVETEFQNVDYDSEVIREIHSLLEEYSKMYKIHKDLIFIWINVVKIILNTKEINALTRTTEFLYELFIDGILYESDYLV